MLTPLLFLMLGAVSAKAADTFSLPPAMPERCSGSCAERYRLRGIGDDVQDAKTRALREDADPCNLVGDKYCLSKRRLIWSSDHRGPAAALANTIGL